MAQHPVTRIAIDFADEKFDTVMHLITKPIKLGDFVNLLQLLWNDDFNEAYFNEIIEELTITMTRISEVAALQLLSEAYIRAKFDLEGLDAQVLSVTDNGPANWPVVEIELNHDKDESIRKLRKLGYDELAIIN